MRFIVQSIMVTSIILVVIVCIVTSLLLALFSTSVPAPLTVREALSIPIKKPAVSPPYSAVSPPAQFVNPPASPLVIKNPELKIFLDRTSNSRVTADISTRLPALTNTSEIEAVALVLRDPTEDDTIRNEAINLLTRSNDLQLADRLITTLDDRANNERFRSFVAQQLGLLLTPDLLSAIHMSVHARLSTALRDKQISVRREALLALCRIHDPQALAIVNTGLSNPDWNGAADLIIYILYQQDLRASLPDIRAFLNFQSEAEIVAALYVIGQWSDTISRDRTEQKCHHENPRISRAAEFCLKN